MSDAEKKAAEDKAAADKAAADKAAVDKAAADDAAKAKKPGRKAPAEGLTSVTVIGPATGRRRAGFGFGQTPVTIDVTEEQLAALKADPMLSVALA